MVGADAVDFDAISTMRDDATSAPNAEVRSRYGTGPRRRSVQPSAASSFATWLNGSHAVQVPREEAGGIPERLGGGDRARNAVRADHNLAVAVLAIAVYPVEKPRWPQAAPHDDRSRPINDVISPMPSP